MTAGFDRYFQIAPCFRDEDGRADRSPGEFYQLDFEMAFVTQEDVFATIEPVLHGVFEEFAGGAAVTPAPFPRIPFDEAMAKYGSDKPDLRNPILIADATDVFRGSSFSAFATAVAAGAVVRAVPAPGASTQPRSFFDKLGQWAREQGAPGLGYVVLGDGGAKGPIAQVSRRGSPRPARGGHRSRATATRCSSSATRSPSPRGSRAVSGFASARSSG